MQGSIRLRGDGATVFPLVWRAVRAFERMRGLLGRPPLAAGEGMLIERCGLVHTFGMKWPLDLVFLDRQGRILKQVAALPPRRIAGCAGAVATLELAAGALASGRLAVGDEIYWQGPA